MGHSNGAVNHAVQLEAFAQWNQQLLAQRSAEQALEWARKFVSWVQAHNHPLTYPRLLYDYGLDLLARGLRVSSAITVTSWARRYLAFLRMSDIAVAEQIPPQFPKDRNRTIKFVPTDDDVTHWIACCAEVPYPYRAVAALLPVTGFRDSEAIALTADAYRVVDGRVILTAEVTKNAHPREVPLLKSGVAEFKRYIFEYRQSINSPWLFPLPRDPNRHVSRKMMEQHVREIRRRADLPQATCHAFRRYFVGRLVDAGVKEAVVAAIIGHSNLATLMKYYGPTGPTLARHVSDAGQ